MKKVVFLSILLGMGAISMAAAVPGGPGLPTMGAGGFVVISPSKSAEIIRPARGKVMLMAAIRKESDNVKDVVFYVDDKEVGRVNAAPYRMEYDSTQLSDGEHSAKFSALDADGNEALTGIVKLRVTNNPGPAAGGAVIPAPEPKPTPSAGGRVIQPTPVRENPVIVAPAVKTYSSDKYDIKFDYPSGFSVKDQSSTLGKDWPKGYWLVVSTEPVAKSEFVVNVRHKQLHQVHTAESYIKYTPYVATWERQDINGKVTFINTAGTPASKRVVHRAIMLSGKDVWMLRCIDASGKPADESKMLFMKIVSSMDYVKNPVGAVRMDAGPAGGVVLPPAPIDEPAPVIPTVEDPVVEGESPADGDVGTPPAAPEADFSE